MLDVRWRVAKQQSLKGNAMKTYTKLLLTLAGVLQFHSAATFAATNTLQVFNDDFGSAPSTHIDPTINVGDTVRWVWASGGIPHSTTAAAGQAESWDSGVHTQPFSFDHTFTQAGTFNYYCSVHGFDAGGGNVAGMSGHVVVQAPTSAVIFFDDFQQFPNGTTLTETNYVPSLGVGAEIKTNENSGEASTTVVASNLLSSTRAFFRLGSPPYSHNYRGDPGGGELTNQPVVLNFKLWIEQTKNATHIGGIGVNLTTTNIDFINGTETNLSHNPLIFLNDGGQVYVFTNNPSPPTQLNNIQIGSWGTLAGTVMNNTLTLDYPAGTFSFAINATVLTNAPIPKFITNIFSRVRIDVFEGLSGAGTLNSLGNRFALDDVRLSSGAPSTNRDVQSYIAGAKGQLFEQFSAGGPSMLATGFAFHADVMGVESNSIIAASVQPPTGASQALMRDDPGSSQLEFNDQFTTKNALDNLYHSSGTYTISIDAQNQGAVMAALNLPADNYPTTPQIVNFTAAQSINSATNFIVRWNAFSGGTSRDFINLEIDDNMGMSFLGTPDIFEPGALDGTATSLTITGGTLQAGTTYEGRLLFVKTSTVDSNSVAGAIGGTGFFKQTFFTLATLAAPGLNCTLAPQLATNDVEATHTVTATVLSNGIAAVGATVDFNVTDGPGLGNTGSDITDGAGHASFSYSSFLDGTDTIQAIATLDSLSSTCTATKVWLPPNTAPVALCLVVTNAADATCHATVTGAQVDDGSFDPDLDGFIVSYVLDPTGPYELGTTAVTLTVTDNRGGTDFCLTAITVVDQTPPVLHCSSNIVVEVAFGVTDAVVNYPALVASDNCSGLVTNCSPPSGTTFLLGTSNVTCTATDGAGNTTNCIFTVTVNQRPPAADLGVTKTTTGQTFGLGQPITYTLVVTNNGPDPTISAQLTDTLLASLTFGSATSDVGGCVFSNGTVVCDFGTLNSGGGATVSLVVTGTVRGQICNGARVTGAVDDPVSANNTSTACVNVVVHDLAVTAIKAPKTLTLTATKTNQTKFVRVFVQNRSDHTETITPGILSNLVALTVESLATNCPNPAAVFHIGPPQKAVPVTLKPKKKFNVVFDVKYDCANDILKGAGREDFRYTARVHHEAIDGETDNHAVDDDCPHDRLPGDHDPFPDGKIKDIGCGGKKLDGSLGADVLTDVVVK